MKLKAIDILNIYESLKVLFDKELELNTSYIIAKNIRELEIVKHVIDEKKNIVIKEYAEKDDKGNIIPSDDKGNIKILKADEFCNKMQEILDSEIDIMLQAISKKEIENLKISPKDLLPLLNILED